MPVNTPGKGKRRFFAVVSLGRDRWYWVVWPSLEELGASAEPLLHVAEGMEKTKAGAVERALGLAGRNAEWVAAKYAKAYHRSKAGTGRKGDSQRSTGSPGAPAAQEYLYRDILDPVTGLWDSAPHRVARKTRLYVFVEQRPYAPGDLTGSWLDQGLPTYRLDRRALERDGYAFIPATAYVAETQEPVFFKGPGGSHASGHGRPLFRCLQVLNLTWPCTVKDVKEAYRKLVRAAHPDGGGDHEKFLALQAAYEQALRLCH